MSAEKTMRYNNDITYHKAWDTQGNNDYRSKVLKLLRGRANCPCDCPPSWAKEVYEFLSFLDEEFGLVYYNLVSLSFLNVMKLLIFDPIRYFCKSPPSFVKESWKSHNRNIFFNTIRYKFVILLRSPLYNFGAIKTAVYGKLYNLIKKPQIKISQVKEKFGEFRLYYTSTPWLEDYLDSQIVELEVRLSLKGVYYQPSNLWDWHSETSVDRRFLGIELNGELFELKDFHYRRALKKLLGIEEFEKLSQIVSKQDLH